MVNVNRIGFSFCFILCILAVIFVYGCGQTPSTVIQDLSLATPTTLAAPDSNAESGSSYVNIHSEEEFKEEFEGEFEQEGLEKRVYREGDLVSFDPVGLDPDGDVIIYKYSKPLDKEGEWQTVVGDTGTYLVTITASDGKTDVEKKIVLLILSANRAPTIEGIDDITAAEGDLIVLKPKIFDYNGDAVILEYSKPFDTNGQWQTDYDDSGIYLVKISASDGQITTEKQATIIVSETNRAPVLNEIQHVSVFGGELVTIIPQATDLDGDAVSFSYTAPLQSDGSWQTAEADVGTYAVTVSASDGLLRDEKVVTVIVNHKNQAPVINLGEVRAEETDRVVLHPIIVDPEGDAFTVQYSEPFDSDGIWVTDYDDGGEYAVTITASDSEGATSSLAVPVLIYNTNRAPVFKI